MATDMLQYLDPDGLDETVLNIGQIKTNLEGQISDLGESIEEELQNLPYALPDGLYPDMTVGAVIGADETAQWATRESTGSGQAIVRSVQGATVALNQLVQVADATRTSNGVTFISSNDGTVVANGEASGNTYATTIDISGIVSGHIYLLKCVPAGGSTSTYRAYLQGDPFASASNRYEYGSGTIVTAAASGAASIVPLYVYSGYTANDLVAIPQLFDLTAMFGSGNEPTTVEEFEQMFPAAYYPYSAPTLKPVQIAGIQSSIDSIEWPTFTLRGVGTIGDMLYSDHVNVRVGVVDLGTLTWTYYGATYPDVFQVDLPSKAVGLSNLLMADGYTYTGQGLSNMPDKSYRGNNNNIKIAIRDTTYTDAATFKAAMSGVYLFYELATPTTQPIDPTLPMTYKVQAGGSESIIVPDGEISAAPVLTVAEPVNAGDEFARIWAAIQSLGYTRNAAQLSRPVSLTDIDSIDEVQKDTPDVVEIDTTKEVQ